MGKATTRDDMKRAQIKAKALNKKTRLSDGQWEWLAMLEYGPMAYRDDSKRMFKKLLKHKLIFVHKGQVGKEVLITATGSAMLCLKRKGKQ